MHPNLSPLITAKGLATALESDPDNWVVFDCRFDLANPDAGRQAYSAGHIPGARYADLDVDLSAEPGPQDGRHPLPDRTRFRSWLGEQGVGPQTPVVAYDDLSGAFAARLWWLLKWLGHEHAAVLSGGMAAWQGAGLESTDETALSAALGPYPDNGLNPAMVVSASAIDKELEAGKQLVDVRAPERYSGAVEPLDPVGGHVPGAVNFPFQNNLDGSGEFLDLETIRSQVQDLLGSQSSEQMIAMCGSGVTACHLLVAMEAAGLKGARLYPGSWSEWIRDPDRPIATGPEPLGTTGD